MISEMKHAFRAKTLFLISLCLLPGAMLYAAQPGQTCSSSISLTPDFKDTITAANTTRWYSASTFDLPLSVFFAPANGASDPAPEVEMDFSCLSGYYEDTILCSLFCRTSGGSGISITMPYKQTLNTDKLPDGTFVYYLSLGKKYRDLLLRMGISYPVDVYVKVVFKSPGILQMAPDNLFNNCVDGAKFMHYGDTVMVAAKDAERHVIVPYVQWQEDTIYYKWEGKAPCTVAVANDCSFKIDDTGAAIEIEHIQPGDSAKVLATEIYKWVHNAEFPNEAGMYFAKCYSEEPGVLTIVKAPQAQPRGKATLLRYDMTYALNANETAIYAIPDSWKNNVIFNTPTAHLFTMLIANDPDFSEAHTLATFAFEKCETGHTKAVLGTELSNCWKKTTEQYLYVKFICTEATTITPERWAVSECYTKTATSLVKPGDEKTLSKKSTTPFRLSYADWVGGDMKITFSINDNCEIYFADTCGMNINKADAPYWLLYKSIVKSTAPLTIPASEIASWADRIDDEGNFYAILYANVNGSRKLKFSTTAEAETDPVYPTVTIAVACDKEGKSYVQVSEAQTVTVKDQSGTVVKTISALPNAKYSIADLPAGNYTLEGKSEKISIKL